jgi:predicted nucleotidyltransferase
MAWKERHTRPDGNKDAVDVWTLLSAYERTPPSNFDCLYEQHISLLESAEHNTDYGIAWLLGHDIRNSLDALTVEQLLSLLGDEKIMKVFARHMTQSSMDDGSQVQDIMQRLIWLEKGLRNC